MRHDLEGDHGGIEARKHESGQEAGNQQPPDIDLGDRGKEHAEGRGRNDHREAAGAEDRPHRHLLAVAAPRHLGDQQRAQHGGVRHRRAGQGGEDGTARDRQVAEASGKAPEDRVEPVKHPDRQAGVKEQRSHEDEHRHRAEHETRDQLRRVVDDLDQAARAGEDQHGEEVGHDEGERDRHADRHEADHHAEKQGECPVPLHGYIPSRTSVRLPYISSTPIRKRRNSTARRKKAIGIGA